MYYNVHRWYEFGTGRYSRADPLPNLRVAAGYSPLDGGRFDPYAYVRQNPLGLTDAHGLEVGDPVPELPKDPCDYYDRVCRETGCNYPCNDAPIYCRGEGSPLAIPGGGSILNIFDPPQTRQCIKQCLVQADSDRRQDPARFCCEGQCGDSDCIGEACITDYHNRCFVRCGSNSWWFGQRAFPGPGVFFPGEGC